MDASISPVWTPAPPAIVRRADGLAAPPALAMLTVTQLVGFGSGGADAPPAAAVLTANSSNAVSSSSYSFASQSFGAASADRCIVVAAVGQSGAGSAAISSLTIGGISAAQLLVVSETSNSLEFWIAAVPTGTSGTVAVNWAVSRARCAIAVWAVTGLLSSALGDSAQETGFGSTPGNGTVNVPAGGVALGMTYDGGTGNRTWSWSGLTEGADASFGGGRSYSAANADFAAAEAGFAVSATPSSNTTGALFGAIVLR